MIGEGGKISPKKSKFDLNAVIEQYRWWIGGILLIAIILSGGYLMWRENYSNDEIRMSNDEQMSQLEQRVQRSEGKIQELENKLIANNSTISAQTSNQSEGSGTVAGAATSNTTKSSTPIGKVNLNTASAAELDTLPGIGAAYAQRIIEYRESKGGFKDISELKNIKGIGDKTYEKLKDLVAI